MNPADDDGDFERWLDGALGRTISAEVGRSAPPRPLFRTGRRRAPLKAAVAVCAVVLGVGGGGAALATGSPNPVSWGHQVVRSVSMGALVPQRTPAPAPAASPSRPSRPMVPAAPSAPAEQSDQDSGQSNANASGQDQQGPAGSSQPPGRSKKSGQGSDQGDQPHGHAHPQGGNQQ